MADRARGFVDAWERLASTGVCSRALFEYVLRLHASEELRAQSDTVVYLLQTLNLICPLSVGGGAEGPGEGGGGYGRGAGSQGVGGGGRGEGAGSRGEGTWGRGGGAGGGTGVIGRPHCGRQRAEVYGGGNDGGGEGGGGGDGRGGGDGGNANVSGLRFRGRQAAEGYDGGGGGREEGGGGREEGGGGSSGGGGGGGGGGGDDDGDDDNDDESDDDNTNPDRRDRPERREPAEHDDEDDNYDVNACNGAEQFLVPAALPRDLPQHHGTWDTHPGDWQLLVDGLPVLPHPAFLRLLCVCAAQDACETQDDLGRPVLVASQSRAAFTFGRSRCYKLEWVTTSEVAHTYHGRLLKVVVAGGGDGDTSSGSLRRGGSEGGFWGRNARDNDNDGGRGSGLGLSGREYVSPQTVVEFVWRSLSEIVRRDFRRCHLRLGVACPYPAPHQVSCGEVIIMIVIYL